MLDGREQERFLRLWADAQPAVAAFVHAVVRDPASAKDVLQETALTLFRRFGDYDGGRPFLAWALGVAKLQVLGFRRDEARSLVTFDSELFDRFTEAWDLPAGTLTAEAVGSNSPRPLSEAGLGAFPSPPPSSYIRPFCEQVCFASVQGLF